MSEKGKVKDRVGEIHTTNKGDKLIITEYFGAYNCTIQFEDGVVLKNIAYSNIKKGAVGKPIDKIGEKWISNERYEMTIISIGKSGEYTVKFNDWNGTILSGLWYSNIKRGNVKNPYHPSVAGVGYLGIGKYTESSAAKHPAHKKWRDMLKRSYSIKGQIQSPTYKGVTVCKEWHNFQIFAQWYEDNWKSNMIDWELDKDILIKGNKVYSAETCCFVPSVINLLLVKSNAKRGAYPLGVTRTRSGKFKAQMLKGGIRIPSNTFNTPEDTFEFYKFHKEKHIKEVADEWKGRIEPQVYNALINYQIEITD